MTKANKGGDLPQLEQQDIERVQQALKKGWNRRDVMKLMMDIFELTNWKEEHLLSII